MNLQIAEFLTSVTDLSKLPKDGLPLPRKRKPDIRQ